MNYERGPLTTYEIIWRSGHIERLDAHQVLWPQSPGMFGEQIGNPRVLVHGEIDGQWKLLLVADEADILSIRAVTVLAEETQ